MASILHNRIMDIRGWDERYRQAETDLEMEPAALLIEMAARLEPGKALDLACGTGRNALWLAERGWDVTAVDGSSVAVGILRRRALERGVGIVALVADL